jgi:hypothetical protein
VLLVSENMILIHPKATVLTTGGLLRKVALPGHKQVIHQVSSKSNEVNPACRIILNCKLCLKGCTVPYTALANAFFLCMLPASDGMGLLIHTSSVTFAS